MLGGPADEKLRGQQQFGLPEHGALDPLADLGGVGGGGAAPARPGLKRALQAVVTDIADKQCPTRCQQIHGIVDDLGQISRVGEVLDDRVENDVSKWPCGRPSVTSAGCTRSRTRSPHGTATATAACRCLIVAADKSVPTYSLTLRGDL